MSFLNSCPIYSINPFLSYHRYYSEILMRDGYMKALLVIKEQVLLSQVPPISKEKREMMPFPFQASVLKVVGEEESFFFFVKQNNKSR